ncbi:MAG: hypothetical protein ACOCV1_08150 [Bacillota bacterium]
MKVNEKLYDCLIRKGHLGDVAEEIQFIYDNEGVSGVYNHIDKHRNHFKETIENDILDWDRENRYDMRKWKAVYFRSIDSWDVDAPTFDKNNKDRYSVLEDPSSFEAKIISAAPDMYFLIKELYELDCTYLSDEYLNKIRKILDKVEKP